VIEDLYKIVVELVLSENLFTNLDGKIFRKYSYSFFEPYGDDYEISLNFVKYF
jgi:hypothetical protein